jgi:mannose-6-phosphate isomerase
MQHYPVKFTPIPQERIWGGGKLKEWFHVDEEGPIGEYWVLSGHPNGMSIVTEGTLAGKTLEDLIKEYPEAYLGKSPQNRFPLLIKFLEATDDLSVQIHPGDDYSQKMENDFGKTEAWHILDCKNDGQVVYGHTFESREDYQHAIEQGKVAKGLKYKNIRKDETVYVPSQTLHALLSGTIVLEIQQTSDVTYRVYDWDRVDEDGKGRELHTDKAADVMLYGEPSSKKDEQELKVLVQSQKVQHDHLVSCAYFSIEKVSLKNECYPLSLGKEGNPDILIVIEGGGELVTGNGSEPLMLKRGDTLLIPSTIREYSVRTHTDMQIIRTYY